MGFGDGDENHADLLVALIEGNGRTEGIGHGWRMSALAARNTAGAGLWPGKIRYGKTISRVKRFLPPATRSIHGPKNILRHDALFS